MGLSDAEKRARDNVLLPHMELIKHYEDDDSGAEEILGVGNLFLVKRQMMNKMKTRMSMYNLKYFFVGKLWAWNFSGNKNID